MLQSFPDRIKSHQATLGSVSDGGSDQTAPIYDVEAFLENTQALEDLEFHARLTNTDASGQQTVVWCADAKMNGCDDERNASTIRITWSR